ncbi:MAG: helix-turn-helix transcriptional regulator [Micromonosporaceae bacterium]|nr:helix-turn-helix transcriptional regulator [Micromonosporaceae bacterium]
MTSELDINAGDLAWFGTCQACLSFDIGRSLRRSGRGRVQLVVTGNKVRELRLVHELSQAQLADAMGVSRQTINSIEVGRYTPSLPLAVGLARFFRSTVEHVFQVDEE